jgi:hypothetical protein
MAVGTLASEDLPEIATEALVRGLDSPALRVLAGQARWDVRVSSDLFHVALDELGIELSDADRAQWHLARRTAGDIVAGRIRAARGAHELWLAYQKVRDSGDLRIFVGLASTLDDHPEDTEHIEAAILAAARELLDWPASGGFDSEHDAERFVAAGQRLVVQLQDELGASYHVEYLPEPIRPPGVKLRTRSNH